VTVGGAKYLGGGDALAGGRAFAAMARELASHVGVLIGVHSDHAPPDAVDGFLRPLIADSVARRARGEPPLFNSHMFDGSTLPLDDNLRRSRELLDLLAAAGIVLELEVGVVGGEEDGVGDADGAPDRRYTTPGDLLRTAEALGVGEHGRYLLAATFGNVHGIRPAGEVELRPEILSQGQDALAAAHPGARFAYVFHGSSGSSPADIQRAIANGVVKINLDTDAQYAFTRAIADHVLANYDGVLKVDGGLGRKAAYDPRAWGAKAEGALAEHVAATARLFGSADRSLLRS
jgi:fructose-bisphosphate aldolase, class II